MELVAGIVLSQLLPDRAAAASGNTSLNFLFGGLDPRTGDYYAHYHFEGMGWGGRATSDGNNAQIVPHGNCRNTPVEIFETRYPWIHHEYSLNADTAGPGKFRGGLGIRRELEVTGDLITVSVLAERMKRHPWGLFGGGEGSFTKVEVKRTGDDHFQTFQDAFHTVSPSKFANIRLHRGDRVRLASPSGGGYGNPLERDPERVAFDVLEGFVSQESARDLYGVVLDSAGRPDLSRTAELRKEKSRGLAQPQ
jgi:N-methylhydantoinase B/oxoprolinase/acetone carboxylase alpha subunit